MKCGKYCVVVYGLLYLVVLYVLIGVRFPLWGDEIHFIRTIKYFSYNGIKAVYDYYEMSTPLPFIIYDYWGKLFGYDIYVLRILSLIVSFFVFLSLYDFIKYYLKSSMLAFLGVVFFSLNPYVIGLSVFVYTDMMAILFFILSVNFFNEERFFLSALFMSLSILSRQYFIFLFLSLVIISIIKFKKTERILRVLFLYFSGLIPLVLLFSIWKGFSPVNTGRMLYLNRHISFSLNSLTLYISLLSVYLFPLYMIQLKRRFSRKDYLLVLFSSLIYMIFPVNSSPVMLERMGIKTVGLFHKFLTNICGFEWSIIWFIVPFIIGILLISKMITVIKENTEEVFLIIIFLSFLFVMPFSYLAWEKYFIPALIPLIPFYLRSFEEYKKD